MKKIYIGLIWLIPLLFIAGCQGSNEVTSEVEETINQVSISELKDMLAEDRQDVFYIDVREEDEYKAGHIEGFSLYPLSTLDKDYQTIPKDKEVVVICRSGNRSMQAVNLLKAKGYGNLSNVTEGMLGWTDPVITVE